MDEAEKDGLLAEPREGAGAGHKVPAVQLDAGAAGMRWGGCGQGLWGICGDVIESGLSAGLTALPSFWPLWTSGLLTHTEWSCCADLHYSNSGGCWRTVSTGTTRLDEIVNAYREAWRS